MLFIFISTYALSSTLIPFLGEGIPVVLLNLQPAPAIDYARLNGMSDRGEMTGEWLANCQACSLPEFCSVFNRAGTTYDVVPVYLDDSLRRFETVYPAAGDDHSAVRLTPEELYRIIPAAGWVSVAK